MRNSTAVLLRLPPDLAAFIDKQAKRKKQSRQAVIYDLITRLMILGDKTK